MMVYNRFCGKEGKFMYDINIYKLKIKNDNLKYVCIHLK